MSKSAGGDLIWTRAEPGSRQPRLTREQISATALTIADLEGFEAVTMRRVAADLDVGTMTLYNYVQTKDDLIALMHDAILAEVLVPAEELESGWRAALAQTSRRLRAALVRHSWAAASLQEALLGPNAMRRFEQYLGVVADTGLSTAAKFDLLTILNSYVFGNALLTGESRKRAGSAEADPERVAAMIQYGRVMLDTGQFPHTSAMYERMNPQAPDTEDSGPPMDEPGLQDQFERGLQALLDGVALHMHLPE